MQYNCICFHMETFLFQKDLLHIIKHSNRIFMLTEVFFNVNQIVNIVHSNYSYNWIEYNHVGSNKEALHKKHFLIYFL